MSKNLCPHCDPYITDSAHIPEKISGMFSVLASFLLPAGRIDKMPQLPQGVNKVIIYGLINTLLTLRILQEVEVSDQDEGIRNRSLVIIREAERRGVPIKVLKVFKKSNIGIFSLEVGGVKRFFDDLPHATIERAYLVDLNDKETVKELLKKNGVPVAQGSVCKNYQEALSCVEKIGFPVVVKPRAGSLSRHTTCNIDTKEGLAEAVRIAQIISRDFLVEKFILGDIYRVTVVDGEVAGVCKREAPNVIGDGIHTVRELVEMKNQDPLRGEPHQKNATLHQIQLGRQAATLLADQGVAPETISPLGTKIYLHNKITLSSGADIHDVTDSVHPDNIALFKKIYDLSKIPVIGIDVISTDISHSHHQEPCAILEVNSLPYIDMHHYPTTGTPRNVAGKVLDYLFVAHRKK